MNLTAKEFGAINITLATSAPEASDRLIAKEIFVALAPHINNESGHFEDGELELNVPQKALLLKMIPLVPWLTPQLIDFVDPLIIKISV